MASKGDAKTRTTARREALNEKHAREAVERFRTSVRGFRRVFGKHFPRHVKEVETLAYHLGQVEALLPNTVEAIRLARYPGAGNRNPKRMALGLCENLSVLKAHVDRSIAEIEEITECKGVGCCPESKRATVVARRR